MPPLSYFAFILDFRVAGVEKYSAAKMKVAPKDGRRREITPPVKMKVVPKIGI